MLAGYANFVMWDKGSLTLIAGAEAIASSAIFHAIFAFSIVAVKKSVFSACVTLFSFIDGQKKRATFRRYRSLILHHKFNFLWFFEFLGTFGRPYNITILYTNQVQVQGFLG